MMPPISFLLSLSHSLLGLIVGSFFLLSGGLGIAGSHRWQGGCLFSLSLLSAFPPVPPIVLLFSGFTDRRSCPLSSSLGHLFREVELLAEWAGGGR